MNENSETTLTKEELNSLFEEPVATEEKEQENVDESSELVPPTDDLTLAPEVTVNEAFESDMEITPDLILDAMTDTNESGYTDAVMIATLNMLHNVTENTTLENIPEEDSEYVDEVVLESAKFDLYSLDGSLFNLVLSFDSPKDAYMQDLNRMLHRYRNMQEQVAESGRQGDVPLFTFTAMPRRLDGQGVLTATFPVAYFRVLNDDNVSASFLLQFHEENIQLASFKLSEEEKTEVVADVMREMDEGTGGSLFDEE